MQTCCDLQGCLQLLLSLTPCRRRAVTNHLSMAASPSAGPAHAQICKASALLCYKPLGIEHCIETRGSGRLRTHTLDRDCGASSHCSVHPGCLPIVYHSYERCSSLFNSSFMNSDEMMGVHLKGRVQRQLAMLCSAVTWAFCPGLLRSFAVSQQAGCCPAFPSSEPWVVALLTHRSSQNITMQYLQDSLLGHACNIQHMCCWQVMATCLHGKKVHCKA